MLGTFLGKDYKKCHKMQTNPPLTNCHDIMLEAAVISNCGDPPVT